jgi:hypothetical protein
MALNKQTAVPAFDHTLIGAPADWLPVPDLRNMSIEAPRLDEGAFGTRQRFKVRFAHSAGGRESAGLLVKKMYGQRGYELSEAAPASLERITIAADFEHSVIGTLTIGLGDSGRLFAEELYPDEVGGLRRQGRHVCEFTRLAIDADVRSKRVIAALFHIAYLYPSKLLGYTEAVIEVNPRHAGFYKRMLGFTELGGERTCPRVSAPAVLLHIDFGFVGRQVQQFGGRCEQALGERSLYPYFFSPEDEAGILRRLARDNP